MLSARAFVHQLRKLASSSSSSKSSLSSIPAIKDFLQCTRVESPTASHEKQTEEVAMIKKLQAPPPPSFFTSSSSSTTPTDSSSSSSQPAATVAIELPPTPPFSFADAMFVIDIAVQTRVCNETVLHCVDIVASDVLQGKAFPTSSNTNTITGSSPSPSSTTIIKSSDQMEYVLSVGNALMSAWNLANEVLVTSSDSDLSCEIKNDKLLFTLRDLVFVKERRALLAILSTVCASFQSHNHQSSSSIKPQPIHFFIADVISNDALLDFHSRRHIREILFLNAGNNMTMLDMFNVYKVIVETKTGACGYLKEQLYRLARDGWYRGFNSTQQQFSSRDFSSSLHNNYNNNNNSINNNDNLSSSVMGTGSGKFIHGKLIPPQQINDEIIKIASQLAITGCDTRSSFTTSQSQPIHQSSPPSAANQYNNSATSSQNSTQQQQNASEGGAASNTTSTPSSQQNETINNNNNNNNNTVNVDSSSSNSGTGMCLGHPSTSDVISSIASVGLEYFKVRYMNSGLRKEVPMVMFVQSQQQQQQQPPSQSSSSHTSDKNNNNNKSEPSQLQKSNLKIRNLRSSSSSSSSQQHQPQSEESSNGAPSSSSVKVLNINNLSKKELQLAIELQERPTFIVSLCVLAGYSNNWEEFSDEQLRYISSQTTRYLKDTFINPPSTSKQPPQLFERGLDFHKAFSCYYESPAAICAALLGSPLISISDQELFVEFIQREEKQQQHFMSPPLNRVLHVLRSQACQASPIITAFVVGTLLPNSFEREYTHINTVTGNGNQSGDLSSSSQQPPHSTAGATSGLEESRIQFLHSTSALIARHLQPSEMMGLGPSLGALSSLLLVKDKNTGNTSPLMKILNLISAELSIASSSSSSTSNSSLLESAEEWLVVVRTCQVALRRAFYEDQDLENLISTISNFCSSLAWLRTKDRSLLLFDVGTQETMSNQDEDAATDCFDLPIEKLRTLLLSYDIVREVTYFVPQESNIIGKNELHELSTALSNSFIDHFSNRTGGDAAHALHIFGIALKSRNVGCLLSKETWDEVAEYYFLPPPPKNNNDYDNAIQQQNQNHNNSNNIIDNIIQQEYLAHFAEICSNVLRENSIAVVTRIAEKVFIIPRAGPPPDVVEQQLCAIRQKYPNLSPQQITNIHYHDNVRRRSQYQLRAAPRIFKALTVFGEWNSRLIAPIVQLIHRLADPVVDSNIFVEVIGAATLKVDDTEVRRRSVELLTTKCLESMLKDETVERYATDEVFTKLLKVVMQAVMSSHSKLVNELTDRIARLPFNSLLEVLKAARFDVHLEKASRKVIVESAEKLVMMTSLSKQQHQQQQQMLLFCGSDGGAATTSNPNSSSSLTITYQQICSANSTSFVPTMVNWASVAPTSGAPLSTEQELQLIEGDQAQDEDEVFDVDEDDQQQQQPDQKSTILNIDGVGKALSKIIRSGDLFSSSSTATTTDHNQKSRIFNHNNIKAGKATNLDFNQTVALLRKFDVDGNCIDQDLTEQFLRIVIARAESMALNPRRLLTMLSNLMFCQRSVPVEALLAIYRPLIHDRKISERRLFATQIMSNWCFMVRLRFPSSVIFETSNLNSSGSENYYSTGSSISNNSNNNISQPHQPLSPQTRDRVRRMTLEMMEALCPFLLLDSSFVKCAEDISFVVANLLHTLAILFVDEKVLMHRSPSHHHPFPSRDDQLFDFDFSSLSSGIGGGGDGDGGARSVPPRLEHWLSRLCGSAVARLKIEQSLRSRHILLRNAIDESDEYLERTMYLMRRYNNNNNNNNGDGADAPTSFSVVSSLPTPPSASLSSPWSSWLHDVDSVNSILNNSQRVFVKYLDDYSQMKRLAFGARWLKHLLEKDHGFRERNPEIVDFCETFL